MHPLSVFTATGLAELTTVVDDRPVQRVVHPIVVDDAVYLHGRAKGPVGWRTPVVLSARDVLAQVPSYLRHPERACPATTWYRSALLEGRLEPVSCADEKARVFAEMMRQWQPEGGYRPLDDAAHYAGPFAGVSVVRVVGDCSVRTKVGGRFPMPVWDTIVEGLWRKGEPGIDHRLELLASIAGRVPSFLQRGAYRLHTRVPGGMTEEAVALLRDQYWNSRWSDATLREAHHGSTAWVGLSLDGRLVGTARAIADGGKHAYVMDVAIHPEHQRAGHGHALMELLLDHPAVRDVEWTGLHTRDAEGFYEKLGFEIWEAPYRRIELRRFRTS